MTCSLKHTIVSYFRIAVNVKFFTGWWSYAPEKNLTKGKHTMKKFCFSLFLCIFSVSCHISAETQKNDVDFSKFPQFHTPSFGMEPWSLGFYAFNSAPELTMYFEKLKQDFQIDTAVETGTFQGSSTVVFSRLFEIVHTIELDKGLFDLAKTNLSPFSNVECHFGSSEKILRELLPSLTNRRVLFYLDAHWDSYWPLRDEIKEIAKTHKDNCIIVVDDFKVPGRSDIDYDRYHDQECSHAYIKNQLDLVFSDYEYLYLIPKFTRARAKFVAIPKKWIGQ